MWIFQFTCSLTRCGRYFALAVGPVGHKSRIRHVHMCWGNVVLVDQEANLLQRTPLSLVICIFWQVLGCIGATATGHIAPGP